MRYSEGMNAIFVAILLMLKLNISFASELSPEFIWFDQYMQTKNEIDQLHFNLALNQARYQSAVSARIELKRQKELFQTYKNNLKKLIKLTTQDQLISSIQLESLQDKIKLYQNLYLEAKSKLKSSHDDYDILLEQLEEAKVNYDRLVELTDRSRLNFTRQLNQCQESKAICLQKQHIKAAQLQWNNAFDQLNRQKEQLSDIAEIYHRSSKDFEFANNQINKLKSQLDEFKTILPEEQVKQQVLEKRLVDYQHANIRLSLALAKVSADELFQNKQAVSSYENLTKLKLDYVVSIKHFTPIRQRYMDNSEIILSAVRDNLSLLKVSETSHLENHVYARLTKQTKFNHLAKQTQINQLILLGFEQGLKASNLNVDDQLPLELVELKTSLINNSELQQLSQLIASEAYQVIEDSLYQEIKQSLDLPQPMLKSFTHLLVNQWFNERQQFVTAITRKVDKLINEQSLLAKAVAQDYINQGIKLSYIKHNK
jgi:hypothetical protein